MFLCIIINDSRKCKLRMTAGETIERNSGLGGGVTKLNSEILFGRCIRIIPSKKRLTTILIIN